MRCRQDGKLPGTRWCGTSIQTWICLDIYVFRSADRALPDESSMWMKGIDAMRHLLTALFAMLMIASFMISPGHASAASRTYTVQPGDTLSKIAAAFGLPSWRPLYEANRDRIQNPNVIHVGQVLVIPGGASTAPPAPAPAPPASSSIEGIITAAAVRYGQSPDAMIAVARCESSLNPNAYNPYSGASGLFQLLPNTWRTTPYAGASVFNAEAKANAAAWMCSVGRRGEWVCLRVRYTKLARQ